MTATEPLWSYKEIAAHIGVQAEIVRAYRKHGLLLTPDVVDEGKPYWFADTVRAWTARRISHRHRQDPND
ncbi:MarR family transcriptional regulator [Streptomyces javensis]|uniref:MarR family transcriptional regulator n=1 Tax=Streptomyces javensis TaxID=114698 RepID=UPI003CD055B9